MMKNEKYTSGNVGNSLRCAQNFKIISSNSHMAPAFINAQFYLCSLDGKFVLSFSLHVCVCVERRGGKYFS